ncbi:hypothetical protein Goarm_014976 [Gossypium armourianum]|uniref:Uncharacterized protein n=1 Tax=Gossypium armourianum TaxID=34283 RepID=A0A7J9J974_9ROSI|nr:hypothetical protein [Gossypium armourianum]
MPGPGPHLMYAMSSGLALTHLTRGRFSPHHTLTYTLNAFFGPDIGSFSEWLTSVLFLDSSVLVFLADSIHHPVYYVLILGLPLCLFYSWASGVLVKRSLLDSVSGVPLSRKQCLLLISAGSFSHFFLDHLFEVNFRDSFFHDMWLIVSDLFIPRFLKMDIRAVVGLGNSLDFENGKSSMYTWILSTGWWINRAPVNPDAVVVVGFLCTCLIGGFIYINRVGLPKSTRKQSYQSMKLIMIIASLYSFWCASQIYWANPRRPAVGEEADLGVLVFLATYFLLPHGLCILSMNSEDLHTDHIPL